jgi:hypothetical protein
VVGLQASAIGLPGRQHRAEATERGGLGLPHQLADILHLPCPRSVLRQIKPGQLDGGQRDKLDSERL